MATRKKVTYAPADEFLAAGEKAFETVTQAFKGYDELIAAGKENIDAVVKANTAAAAGAERLGTAFVEHLNGAYEANVAAAKALGAAKTVEEAVRLQTDHVVASFDAAVTKGTELAEVAATVAKEVTDPLQARAKVAFEATLKPLAA